MANFFCFEGCPPKANEWRSEPRIFLHHVWAFMTFVLVALLIAFSIFAAYAFSNHSSNSGIAFMGIWATIMAVGFSIFTHLVLTKWRSSFSVGALIGSSALMSQFFLVLGVIYADTAADHGKNSGSGDQDHKNYDIANEAMAVVSFFLMFAYGTFAICCVKNCDSIIVKDSPPEESSS